MYKGLFPTLQADNAFWVTSHRQSSWKTQSNSTPSPSNQASEHSPMLIAFIMPASTILYFATPKRVTNDCHHRLHYTASTYDFHSE